MPLTKFAFLLGTFTTIAATAIYMLATAESKNPSRKKTSARRSDSENHN